MKINCVSNYFYFKILTKLAAQILITAEMTNEDGASMSLRCLLSQRWIALVVDHVKRGKAAWYITCTGHHVHWLVILILELW